VGAVLAARKSDEPFYAIRPHELNGAARHFTGQFPGTVLYAVSANPHPEFLHALGAGGIRHFDVASLNELRSVRAYVGDAVCYAAAPVKSVGFIREAAHDYGVSVFGADHPDELAKIIVHTAPLKPMILIRLAPPKGAGWDPSGKFGCSAAEAAALMRAAAAEGLGIGLGFRLGAQRLDPGEWCASLATVGDTIKASNIQPELISVGGGFPFARRNLGVPPLKDYIDAIRDGLSKLPLHNPPRLICMPGRSLAAAGASLVVKVELRRGNRLYLNDGMHGGLAELHLHAADPPLRVWRINGGVKLLTAPLDQFAFYGPTGDAADMIPGPFALPAEIGMGDYIEIGQMGAFSMSLRSDFGGFLSAASVIVNDPAQQF
jgi:ornithine decarboxylase